ncbi:MAG: YqeG family HAD IIIA-type phosphatase [Tenericutes bacterium]|nr:MAG: YqeG family HAD IIIA-type phosphatase [Mycoplasmatota bacterium]
MKNYGKELNQQTTSTENKSFVFGIFINFLRPSAYQTSILDIDLDQLKDQGIKLIICDLDNTLVPHFTKFPTKYAKKFVDSALEKDFDFVLLSNNTSRRVGFFAEKLGLTDFISGAKKPFPFSIKKEIKRHNLTPAQTVIIGDMLVTDTLAANFIGAESILVQPLIDGEQT